MPVHCRRVPSKHLQRRQPEHNPSSAFVLIHQGDGALWCAVQHAHTLSRARRSTPRTTLGENKCFLQHTNRLAGLIVCNQRKSQKPIARDIVRVHSQIATEFANSFVEIRKGDKLEGRLKLFDVKEVQDYVRELGVKLLPPAADVTARSLEFRFYVVEDPSINAAALPDGTVLVNTGLLGTIENESQLAFD